MHSAFPGLSHVGADTPFAGVAFDKMRRPGTERTFNTVGKNVSRPFHPYREPRQSTRFGPPHNNSFSRSKDGIYLMRLPSGMRGARADCRYVA